MAKKVPTPKKPAEDGNKQLVEAIVTVKNLQGFIQRNGGLEKSVEAVATVEQLVKLTGSFNALKQALNIVGKEESAPQG